MGVHSGNWQIIKYYINISYGTLVKGEISALDSSEIEVLGSFSRIIASILRHEAVLSGPVSRTEILSLVHSSESIA